MQHRDILEEDLLDQTFAQRDTAECQVSWSVDGRLVRTSLLLCDDILHVIELTSPRRCRAYPLSAIAKVEVATTRGGGFVLSRGASSPIVLFAFADAERDVVEQFLQRLQSTLTSSCDSAPRTHFSSAGAPPRRSDLSIAGASFALLRPFVPQLTVTSALILVVSGLQILPFLLTPRLIDSLGRSHSDVALMSGLIALTLVTVIVLGIARDTLFASIASDVGAHLQKQLLTRALAPSHASPTWVPPSIASLTTDINEVRDTLLQFIRVISGHGLMVVISAILLLSINPRLFFISIAGAPLSLFLLHYCWKRASLRYARYLHESAKVAEGLHELCTHRGTVLLSGTEALERERHLHFITSESLARTRAETTTSTLLPLSALSFELPIAFVWYSASFLIMEAQLSVGEVVTFVAYVRFMSAPMRELSQLQGSVVKGISAARRLFSFTASCPAPFAPPPNPTRDPVEAVQADSEFPDLLLQAHSVTLSRNGRKILQDTELSIFRGERLGICGPSGVGKTSLAKILCGSDIPTTGAFLRGPNIVRPPSLSYTGQAAFLFRRSYRDNISYGLDNPDERDVVLAAHQVRLHEHILLAREAYDAQIPLDKLSGGERQRIGLARALLLQPDILVLDEALTALDEETKQAVLLALAQSRSETATIYISHDADILAHCDRVLELSSDGRLNLKHRSPHSCRTTQLTSKVSPDLLMPTHEEVQRLLEDPRIERGLFSARSLFPITNPDRLIELTLIGDTNTERARIIDTSILSRLTAETVADLRRRSERIPTVTSIEHLDARVSSVKWTVSTDRGKHRFSSSDEALLSVLASGGGILNDINGHPVQIPILGRLDAVSRDVLHRAC